MWSSGGRTKDLAGLTARRSVADREDGQAIALQELARRGSVSQDAISRLKKNLREEVSNFNHTTIDWLVDQGKYRRFCRYAREQNHLLGTRGALLNAFNAAQAWIILTLVAILTAFTGALIHTGAEWLTSFKSGTCARDGWWISRSICCIDSETGPCSSFEKWGTQALSGSDPDDPRHYWLNFFLYILFGVSIAVLCGWIVGTFSHLAAGSGLPQVKTILGGFVIKRFLGGWTLFIKSVGLILAVGSGLNIGKEGPIVHIACCWGNIVSRAFSKFSWNEAKRREIMSASAAAGVAVAFGAPLGGVLFSLEAVSSYFPQKTMWRSFFCAILSTLVVQYADPFATGKLVQFQVVEHYVWNWFELFPFILIGCVGGVVGAAFIKANMKLRHFREGHPWIVHHPVLEIFAVALITCIFNFPNVYMRGSSGLLLERLFGDCGEHFEWTDPDDPASDLCHQSDSGNLWLLFLTFVSKMLLLTLTFGLRIPTGLFIPSLTGGACLGRMVGWAMYLFHQSVGDNYMFKVCAEKTRCINPGLYAIVGASAVLGGVTRLTISLAVVMFELTGGLEHIIPIMVAVTCAKWVGDAFGGEGIYDAVTHMHGYPYIDPNSEIDFRENATNVMTPEPICLTSKSNTLQSLIDLLDRCPFHGFPIIEAVQDRRLCGFITRGDLQIALNDTARKQVLPSTLVNFVPLSADQDLGLDVVDFASYTDLCPLTVTPGTPSDRILDMFKALGVSYIIVCNDGYVCGIIKKKDLLLHLGIEKGRFTGLDFGLHLQDSPINEPLVSRDEHLSSSSNYEPLQHD